MATGERTYAKIRVACEPDSGLARVTLDAGRGNVIDRAVAGELREALVDLGGRPGVRLVVIAGAGPHFSYGASVEEHRPEQAADMLRDLNRLFATMLELPLPTLALVRGCCLGGGLELASLCSVIFAEEGASLGQPEIRLGVFPPAAAAILPLKLGQAAAEELLLTGRAVSAQEAWALGLVQQVVPAGEGDRAVEDYYQEHFAGRSAISLRHTVRAARWHFASLVKPALAQLEQYYLSDLMATRDAPEGIQAFLDKRPPAWQHC